MTTALIVEASPGAASDLARDLAAVGIRVLGAAQRGHVVHDAAQAAPDVVVCHETSADDALFAEFATLAETAPRPVVVFTNDPDATKIERALGAGIHAYVVNGYGVQRLRAVVHVARARFEHDHRLRRELADVTRRFDERKLVDRAKGILMRARQVSEEEAFGVLRAASMQSNRRVGQVSRQVIAAAHYADSVNRAGKLRMLSQRLVKACTLCAFEPAGAGCERQSADSVAQIDANIAVLAKNLSKPTFGDLLDGVEASWAELKTIAASSTAGQRFGDLDAGSRAPVAERLGRLDAAAEQLLLQAEQLTRLLETAGLVTTLHVINVSGRQRMLTQRYAKQALLTLLDEAATAPGRRTDMDATARTFDEAMAELGAMPLSTTEIKALLGDAARLWGDVVKAARGVRSPAGARALDASSEALLEVFEALTDRYERSMQVLMG